MPPSVTYFEWIQNLLLSKGGVNYPLSIQINHINVRFLWDDLKSAAFCLREEYRIRPPPGGNAKDSVLSFA